MFKGYFEIRIWIWTEFTGVVCVRFVLISACVCRNLRVRINRTVPLVVVRGSIDQQHRSRVDSKARKWRELSEDVVVSILGDTF